MNNEAGELIKQLRAMQLQFKEIVNSFGRLIRHSPKSCLLCYIICVDIRGLSRGQYTCSSDCSSLSGLASLSSLFNRVALILTWILEKGSTHSASWEKINLAKLQSSLHSSSLWTCISGNGFLEHEHLLRQK